MQIDTFLKEGKAIEEYLNDQIVVTEKQIEDMPLEVIDNDSRSYPGFLHYRWNRVYSGLKPFLKKEDNILELACRTGLFCHYMFQRGYENVYGIDICEKAIKLANKHCAGTNCVVGDIHKMPWDDQFFDAICATEIIEHSYDPPLLFRELRRVLKDDGIIFTTVPIEAPPKNEQISIDVGHVIFFPHPSIFQQYAADNGFASHVFDYNLYPPNDEGKLWLQGCGFLLKKIEVVD